MLNFSYPVSLFISNFDFIIIRGPPGDLFVYLDVEEISGIQRDGINLNSTISISYLDAILGTVVKVSGYYLRRKFFANFIV